MSDAAAHLSKLRAMLARGTTLRQAQAETGVSERTIRRRAEAAQWPRRRRHRLSAKQKRQIQRAVSQETLDGHRATLRRIAALAGCSVSTVWRHLNPALPGGPRKVRVYTCPQGHRTYLKPCQMCRAIGLAPGDAPERRS